MNLGIANVLKQRIGNQEPEEVREAAWETLSALFKKAGDGGAADLESIFA
jgi:hypothetical protein